jgi:uncharacterized protein YciI
MFIVLLRFSENRARSGEFLEGHKAWIQRGTEDGVFLLVGSLEPKLGGAILAHGVSLAELERRVDADPFVEHRVVNAEILQVNPSRADERLRILLS